MQERKKMPLTRQAVIDRHETFRRTGHFPDCRIFGCDMTRCDHARFVQRWEPCRG